MPIVNELIISPQILMNEKQQYLLEDYGFFEFELLGHVFSVMTLKRGDLAFDTYIRKSLAIKQPFFSGYRTVRTYDDLDITLNRAFSKRG